jgi:hypothetical protein
VVFRAFATKIGRVLAARAGVADFFTGSQGFGSKADRTQDDLIHIVSIFPVFIPTSDVILAPLMRAQGFWGACGCLFAAGVQAAISSP